MNYAVLLLEDDLITLELLQGLLEDQGFTVWPASTVTQARQLARQHKINIILTDMSLPDGNGVELMKDLNQDRSKYGILMSGNEKNDTLTELGFFAQLTKPIDFAVLDQELFAARRWVQALNVDQ